MAREAVVNSVVIPLLQREFDAEGITGVEIGLIDDVVKSGPPSGKAILFQRITNTPRGHVGRYNKLDMAADEFVHTEKQAFERSYQFTALCPIMASQDYPLTPSDLADLARSFLLSDIAIDEFAKIGMQVQSATVVRDLYHKDESGRFEKQPSFDLVLTGSLDVIRKVAKADPVTGKFYRAQQG